LAVVTPTAVGLLAFVRHFHFHQSDAKGESIRPEFPYEVRFANLAFALVAFLAYFGGWAVGACGPRLRPVSSAGGAPAHLAVRARRRSPAPLTSECLTRAGLQLDIVLAGLQ
jgi:hypothetical protein